MSVQDLVANAKAGIDESILRAIPKKYVILLVDFCRWANVRGICVKSETSIALPLYEKVPDHPLALDIADAASDASDNNK